MNQFEEVAGMSRSIHARLQAAIEQSKIFNNREMLTGLSETEYSGLLQTNKEF